MNIIIVVYFFISFCLLCCLLIIIFYLYYCLSVVINFINFSFTLTALYCIIMYFSAKDYYNLLYTQNFE